MWLLCDITAVDVQLSPDPVLVRVHVRVPFFHQIDLVLGLEKACFQLGRVVPLGLGESDLDFQSGDSVGLLGVELGFDPVVEGGTEGFADVEVTVAFEVGRNLSRLHVLVLDVESVLGVRTEVLEGLGSTTTGESRAGE